MKKSINQSKIKSFTLSEVDGAYTLPSASVCIQELHCHDFYEFAYVDNGSIICNCSKVETVLNQNEFFLIKPNEPHNYKSNKNKSASVFIVCFSCKSDFLQLITDKTTVDDYSKLILSKILSEAHNAFKFPFNKKLLICENPIFGAQQLINNAIEELLINLIRQKINLSKEISIVSNKEELHNNVVRDIILLLKQKIKFFRLVVPKKMQ